MLTTGLCIARWQANLEGQVARVETEKHEQMQDYEAKLTKVSIEKRALGEAMQQAQVEVCRLLILAVLTVSRAFCRRAAPGP